MALLLPEFVDVVRLLLDLTNQLANKSRSDAKASCCLLVVEILNTYSLPHFLDNFCGQLSSRHRFAPIWFLVKLQFSTFRYELVVLLACHLASCQALDRCVKDLLCRR